MTSGVYPLTNPFVEALRETGQLSSHSRECKRCGLTWYEHNDHAHMVLSLGGLIPCPFGDCGVYE